MALNSLSRQDRMVSVALTAAVTAMVGWLLLIGLRLPGVVPTEDPLAVFSVVPPREVPHPKTVPARKHQRRKAGRAAPPNLRSTATQVVAPPPIVPVPVPPPVVVAPVANTGAAPTQGAALRAGPGTGAGGIGDGFGSGGDGDGDGDGWRDETPPRRIKGRIKDSDYPKAADDAGASGTVSVRIRVNTVGRVDECVVTGSSGSAVLDETTCRLIQQRYRYEPSRDGQGRPVTSYVVFDNDWLMEREPVPPAPPRR
ncbi:protein TonB [Sphingomonas gellani]|uniref:Protein TonB n=1 Tax=Sphingomonas gellani TaxID=1166340 RepID=A0A1H8HKK7_9SPHN|nr:energy transducer TonB [Sphingomonas gellani]SEN56663.1 protein TonB [Sphingomonas gellani]